MKRKEKKGGSPSKGKPEQEKIQTKRGLFYTKEGYKRLVESGKKGGAIVKAKRAQYKPRKRGVVVLLDNGLRDRFYSWLRGKPLFERWRITDSEFAAAISNAEGKTR